MYHSLSELWLQDCPQIHLFIQKIFIEHLLYGRHCSEQMNDKNPSPLKSYITSNCGRSIEVIAQSLNGGTTCGREQ